MSSDAVPISTAALKRAADKPDTSGRLTAVESRRTRFTDLPLPARLLLAVPRARGVERKVPIAERYVLDTLGRIIDAGPDRRATIEAVNLLAEILLVSERPVADAECTDPRWLSAVEDMMLCMLCRIQGGHREEAASLARHWLDAPSVAAFSKAAAALCNADCFRRGGSQVFTPSWQGMPDHSGDVPHQPVHRSGDLSLGESLLLNALRLRKRTLSHVGLGARVVPLLCHHVALPNLQTVVDAMLVEFIRHGYRPPNIQCLCSPFVSADEAIYLGTMAAFAAGDSTRGEQWLSASLPGNSVRRLLSSQHDYSSVLRQTDTPIPTRQWDISDLRARELLYQPCDHVNEPPMIH